MTYKFIKYEAADGVAAITLNRPEKLNAMNRPMRDEICAAADAAEADENVSVILIRGEGRAFCSGYDVSPDPAETGWVLDEDGYKMHKRYQETYSAHWVEHLWRNQKPVVASVHGYCIAGGLDLADSCDLIIAADDTEFGLPESRFGAILMAFLPWTLGMRKAKELIFTSQNISAERAHSLGMVNRVVARADLATETQNLVGTIAKMPAETLYFGKLAVNRAFEISGILSAVRQSYDLNIFAHLTDGAMRTWGRIRKERGVKAAFEWRDRNF